MAASNAKVVAFVNTTLSPLNTPAACTPVGYGDISGGTALEQVGICIYVMLCLARALV